MKNSALVIGGGGSKGAFAVGIVNHFKKTYDYYIGTSTGALIVAMVACNKFIQLKNAYLNLNTNKIFSDNPYRKNGKINKVKAVKRFLFGKDSLGNTDALLNFIRENFTEQDFETTKKLKREIIVTVTNLDTKLTEYKSSFDYDYKQFTRWIWVSTLAYPFTDHYGGYADGGYTCPLPILKATELALNIDAIVLQEETPTNKFKPANVLQGIGNIIGVFLRDSLNDDIKQAGKSQSKINYYFTPYKLTNNSMFFDRRKMLEWYYLGINRAKQQ